jgi:hypothetical protein
MKVVEALIGLDIDFENIAGFDFLHGHLTIHLAKRQLLSVLAHALS